MSKRAEPTTTPVPQNSKFMCKLFSNLLFILHSQKENEQTAISIQTRKNGGEEYRQPLNAIANIRLIFSVSGINTNWFLSTFIPQQNNNNK